MFQTVSALSSRYLGGLGVTLCKSTLSHVPTDRSIGNLATGGFGSSAAPMPAVIHSWHGRPLSPVATHETCAWLASAVLPAPLPADLPPASVGAGVPTAHGPWWVLSGGSDRRVLQLVDKEKVQ